ncbi:MAG: hypothetical protein A3J06_00565 [Candidatus Moranbacteria bacterium RIFCSPLOWO2_02_FULL_48_19]|nr:MAG: hypothetical protein A3J06_00565 [Candidatus Moranbacteria bacterium RIFCSPLOWO2_02_FULL_48_19]OGI31713.1 MAG: hypothetical protein A3G09_02745 [Candidatus Moranbacteria bacterium RIFCSPLOWO2_12_FULL_48_12]
MPLNIQFALKKVSTGILDTLFPIRCLSCDAPEEYLCGACLATFPRRLRERCPTCLKATTPQGEVCFACSGIKALDGLFAASVYRSPLVAASLHIFKYRFIPAVATPLGGWLAEKIVEADLLLPDYCIPVPLHPRRRRFRGFNQSALLAHTLANTLTPGLDMPVLEDCLLRTRFTKPQIKTKSREERLGNLKGAFAFTDESIPLIQNKMLWLIDDVATTGTTLEECAMVLKKAGAKKVFGIVLAR